MAVSDRGILGFGAYLPRRRLQRAAIFAAHRWFAPGLAGLAKGERSIGNWDEDAVTMAVEAARDCLTGVDRTRIGALAFACTTHPFAERLNAGIVKEALVLRDDVRARDASGSRRAGLSALADALSGAGHMLCVAADRGVSAPASEGELQQGDGAAAILVGEGPIIARLIGAHASTVDFVDQYRSADARFSYGWETRWIRDEGYEKLLGGAIRDALKAAKIDPAGIDHAAIAVPQASLAASLAKKAGIRAEALVDTLSAAIGDTGAAHPLLLLAAALEAAKPGQRVLVAGFGQGAEVLVFETTPALADLAPRRGVRGNLAAGIKDSNYMRFLFHRGLVPLERGMRAELDQKQPGSTLYRHRKTVLGLVGGRCTKTGTVQFPRSDIGVNQNDRSIGTQEDYPLADRTARIVSFTADSLTYSPDPPTFYGTIDFEGGGRLVAEFAEVTADEVEVGRPMRMVFRIKAEDEQRNFVKYFWKATPIALGEK